MKKDLTKISDLNPKEILEIIEMAFRYKNGELDDQVLKGKVVAMVFEKPSLRTKVAFEVATAKLGGIPVYLTSGQIMASGNNEKGRESIPDISKNLERFADLILARVYSHSTIQAIAGAVKIPLINALCDKHHPTQALADLMAIIWHKKNYKKLKVAFVGDGNNVATSLMQICALVGMDFSIASPKGYEISQEAYEEIYEQKLANDVVIEFCENPAEALENADVVYTDTFISMGEEDLKSSKMKAFAGYQVNKKLLSFAKPDAIFMHCLPAHRGEEVTDEVMDSPQSVIFDQAECRMHIAKALLTNYLKNHDKFN
jgi:ornithine carbamoyltransferase